MRRNPGQVALAALSLVCVLLLAACSSSTPTLRYLTISPTTAMVDVGSTTTFSAQAYYSNGAIQNGTGLVSWSTSNSAVATVSAGVVTGVSSGTATITASSAGVSPVTATVTVNAPTSISVTPASATIDVAGTQQFTATGTFADGTSGNISSFVTWTSGTPTVATINTSGLATGVAAGSSTITATLGTATPGTATLKVQATGAPVPVSISVTPATPTIAIGNTEAFTAMEVWSDGSMHAPSGTVAWNSGTTATATFAPASNIALGLAAGSSTITATEGTLTPGTAALTVVTGSSHYAYVANSSDFSNSISEYSVDATSMTTPFTSIGSVAENTPPAQVLPHPSGKYLYAIDTSGFLWVYDVNPSTGALTFTNQPLVAAASASSANYETIDPYGRFIYVVNPGSNTIQGFQISQTDGSLSNGTSSTTNLNSPNSAIVDPTGSFLYVLNIGNNTLSGYSIDQSSGALTPLSTATFTTGFAPFYAALNPSGADLFVANNGSATVTGSVSVFTTSPSNGILGGGTQTTITGSTNLFNVVVDPSGTYLYVLDSGLSPATGQVYGYTITNGVLGSTAISGTPQSVGVSPTGIAIDRSGAIIAVDNTGANTISLLQVESGGALTPFTPPTILAGNNPTLVVFYNAP